MIEKSIYEDYEIDFSDTYESDDAYYFIFNDERELLLSENKTLPTSFENIDISFKLYIGKYMDKDTFIINTSSEGSFFSLIDVYDIDKDI